MTGGIFRCSRRLPKNPRENARGPQPFHNTIVPGGVYAGGSGGGETSPSTSLSKSLFDKLRRRAPWKGRAAVAPNDAIQRRFVQKPECRQKTVG